MSDPQRPAPAPSHPSLTFAQAVFGFVALSGAVCIAIAAAIFVSRSDALLTQALDRAVRVRTEAAADAFAAEIHDEWRSALALARSGTVAGRGRGGALEGMLDGLRGDGTRVVSAAFADPSGRVVAAAPRAETGRDASAAPWLRNGLERPHVAALREGPVLLELSAPAGGADAAGGGVLTLRIGRDWATRRLEAAGAALALDLYLMDAEAAVILSPGGAAPDPAARRLLEAAATGGAVSGQEVWPDGKVHFTSTVARVLHPDMPGAGWRLIGRLDGDGFVPDVDRLRRVTLYGLAAVISALTAMTAVFVMVFVRPLARLADTAEAIAEGGQDYPPDGQRTREAAQISGALVRLQRPPR